jgi:DNA damage-binding protein 1
MLVLSFVEDTRILRITDDGEMTEESLDGFDGDSMTLACSNVVGDAIVQVTPNSVNLIGLGKGHLDTWKPRGRIQSASINASQVVCALDGGELVYFKVSEKLDESGRVKMEHDIASVDITPTHGNESNWCAVGLWTDNSVRILSLPSLKQVAKQELGGDIIPRSVLLAHFGTACYLFVGMGDGQMFSFLRDEASGQLMDKRRISLGTQPITLTSFTDARGRDFVFSSSDRPTVIGMSTSGGKLQYSAVTLPNATSMCAFKATSFPNALAFATENQLLIGTLDEIQKLDIRTVRLGETPRRICHQPSSRTFAVVSQRLSVEEGTGNETEEGVLRIFDHSSWDVLDTVPLEADEHGAECGWSIISTTLGSDPRTYFIVGTAFVRPEDEEPRKGRILVYHVTDNRQLELISQTTVKASVSHLLMMSDGKLVAAVGSKIVLYQWTNGLDGNPTLVRRAAHHGNILIVSIVVHNDFLFVGDLMKSVNVLAYKNDGFEEVARDYDSNWVLAGEMLDDDNYVFADSYGNLSSVRKNTETVNPDLRKRLEHAGEYHLADMVNKFRHGALVVNPEEEATSVATSRLLFATVSGCLGVISTIDTHHFNILKSFERNLELYLTNVGLPHAR